MRMKSLKQLIRRVPVVGATLIRFKQLLPTSSIRGRKNVVTNRGTFRAVKLDIVGDNNEIRIGRNTRISNTTFVLRGDDHRIVIEEDCAIGGGELWIEDSRGSIIIRRGTTIESAHLAVTEPSSCLEIREDCMLAHDVEIRTGDSHAIIDLNTGDRINPAANVTLLEHVWVGAHARVLKGVTVGRNSVIATSAVVANDVPPHSIVGGVPARVIRSHIDWKRTR